MAIGNTISNCNFYGVKFSEEFIHLAEEIIAALLVNARALENMTQVIRGSNVTIDAMIRLTPEDAVSNVYQEEEVERR